MSALAATHRLQAWHPPAADVGAATLLAVEDVHLRFGGVAAVQGVTFAVEAGETYAIIGPNGAGKTSLLNLINGIYKPAAGRVRFLGRDCARMSAQAIADAGIARTFQNIALFKGLNVADNVMIGRHRSMRSGLFACGMFWGRAQVEEVEHREAVQNLLEFLEVAHLRDTPVEELSYGLQKRVEIARALALMPRLLLLDEPMAGMNHHDKSDIVRLIRAVNASFGTTIILIEHDIGVVMDLSSRVLVLDHGVKIAEGLPSEIRTNDRVIKAYLGEED